VRKVVLICRGRAGPRRGVLRHGRGGHALLQEAEPAADVEPAAPSGHGPAPVRAGAREPRA